MFATFELTGVSKSDGTNWTTYNLSDSELAHDRVSAMAVGAFGNGCSELAMVSANFMNSLSFFGIRTAVL